MCGLSILGGRWGLDDRGSKGKYYYYYYYYYYCRFDSLLVTLARIYAVSVENILSAKKFMWASMSSDPEK